MKNRAFTLIELIVSITIFSVIVVSVYSAFNIGIKAWRTASQRRPLQQIRLMFLKMDKEIKDTFFFSSIPFRGTDKGIVFPLSVPDGDAEKLFIISYAIDTDKKTGLKRLIRKESSYKDKGQDVKEVSKFISPPLKEIKFAYAYKAEGASRDFEWAESWDGETRKKLPSGIRISVVAKDDSQIYNKVIFIPHGDLSAK